MNDPALGIALIILLGLIILPMCYFTGASMIANLREAYRIHRVRKLIEGRDVVVIDCEVTK